MDDEGFLVRRASERVGTVLRDKWTLDQLLGVGGMAAVYAATHRNGKRGAVKMLHVELSLQQEGRRRFLREGYVANRVGHPGAVSVLDDDVAEDGSVFLVMELLEGRTVAATAALAPGGRLEPADVLRIADQVLDALASAHDKGIIHRDLKPDNVFITHEGRVKILDFGIARLREMPGGMRVTRTGAAMGTPPFMPPEQALGNNEQIDARTDIWALGATMFTLLTGRYVHEADTLNKQLLAAMTVPAPPLRSILPEIHPAAAQVVDTALAFDQKLRFADARAMQAAIRAIDPSALVAPPLPALAPGVTSAAVEKPAMTAASLARDSLEPARRRRGWAPLLVGAAAGALFIGGIAFVGLRATEPPPAADIRTVEPVVPSEAPHPAAPPPEDAVEPPAQPPPAAAPAPAKPDVEPPPRASAGPLPATSASAEPSSPPGAPGAPGTAPAPRPIPAPGAPVPLPSKPSDPLRKW